MGRKMERKKLKKKGIGSACAILSATLFGFNAYCATNAYAGGSNPIAFTFYASVICIDVHMVSPFPVSLHLFIFM